MQIMRKSLAVVGAVFIILATSNLNATAQSGQGLEISPPLIELNVDPGKTVTFDIRLRNVIKTTLIARATIDDFVSGGEDGQPKLLIDQDAEPSPYSMKSWVSQISEVRLSSEEAKTAKVTLNVPKNASPGGHYGVIRFTGTAPDIDSTGVALSASIGTLVLVNVSGEIKTSAKFEDFFTAQNGKRGGFFENGPITITQRIKNEGSVHIKPTGTVRVTNMLGKEVGVMSINEKGGNILPTGIRKFEQQLKKRWMIGKYSIEANVQYSGKTITDSISFWVIPYKLISMVLGGLIIVFVVLRKGLKRYNQMIINKAKEGNGGKKGK